MNVLYSVLDRYMYDYKTVALCQKLRIKENEKGQDLKCIRIT